MKFNGVLGFLDFILGRIRDSGRPSFGATVFILFSLPGVFLITAKSCSLLISPVQISDLKEVSTDIKSKKRSKSFKTTAANQIGWPIACLCGLFFIVGLVCHLMRKRNDRKAVIELGDMIAKIYGGKVVSNIPERLELIKPVLSKLGDTEKGDI